MYTALSFSLILMSKKRWNFMKFCMVNIANSSTTKIVFFPFFLPSSFLHPSLLSLSLFFFFFPFFVHCLVYLSIWFYNSLEVNTFFSFLSHTTYTNCSFPSLPFLNFPYTFPLHQIHSSSISLEKRAGLPMIETEHGIAACNKTKHQSYIKSRQLDSGHVIRETESPEYKTRKAKDMVNFESHI